MVLLASCSCINRPPPCPISDGEQSRTITESVLDDLKNNIHSGQNAHRIPKDHECFKEAKEFCKQWNISDRASDNFESLLSGYQHFPLLLLINPTNDHDKTYDKMIKCSTLKWIAKTLGTMGLTLEDIPILNICSFFSDEDLEKLEKKSGKAKRNEAIQAAYDLAEKIIGLLQPTAIVSCQCRTSGTDSWMQAKNRLALDLCSRTKWAVDRKVARFAYGNFWFWCFWGFHPHFHKFGTKEKLEEVIVDLFKDVYGPCGSWKRTLVKEEDSIIRADYNSTSQTATIRVSVGTTFPSSINLKEPY